MSYLELLSKFWQYNQQYKFGSIPTAVYLYILQKWNEEEQVDLIRISDVSISENLILSRRTIKVTKEKLRNYGLIQYQTKSGFPTHYRIVKDYSIIETKNKTRNVVDNKLKIDHHLAATIPFEFEKTVTIDEKKQQDTNIHKENDFNPVPKEIASSVSKPKNIPSLKEFMDHAKTFAVYAPTYDFALEAKYEQWLANGWINGNGVEIKNWKAALKSSFAYLKPLNGENAKKVTESVSLQKIGRFKNTYNE